MKLALVLTVGLFSLAAQAGSFVCAGKTVHYSADRADMGMIPEKPIRVGEEFLSVKGQLQGRRDLFSDGTTAGAWNLKLSVSDKTQLASGGGEVSGWKVSSAKLTVTVDGKPLVEEPVTCRETWAMVP